MIIVWKNSLYAGNPDALGMNGFGVFNWSASVTAPIVTYSPLRFYPSAAQRIAMAQESGQRIQSKPQSGQRIQFTPDGRPISS